MRITDIEYEKLVKRLEQFIAIRNNLLTFSFTAVLAVLGIALEVEMNARSSWICLLPYFLIFPFAARIAYYRLANAHISSFLRTFAKDRMQFELGAAVVTEGKGFRFNMIAWLVNHEMVMLGLATSCIFIFKFFPNIQRWTWLSCIGLCIPVILVLVVFIISDSTFNLKKLHSSFSTEWSTYAAKEATKCGPPQ